MAGVINLRNTTQGKFQLLVDALNKTGPVIKDLEAQFGTLGMVSRVEKYLEILMAKKLGWNVKIYPEIKNSYIIKIMTSTIIPTLILSRKFALDIIKAAKSNAIPVVVKDLKNQLAAAAHSVRDDGVDPFEESCNKYNYIMIEASTAGGCFHGAIPVNAISLVDTDDADQAYVAHELKNKKDHFILKPTTEQIKNHLVRFCRENNLEEYLKILRSGNIIIIKEHIQEDVNKNYKILGKNIILSKIRSHNVL